MEWSLPSLCVQTNLNTLCIHLVPFFCFRPIQTGISFLRNQEIRVVNLFELQFDGADKGRRYDFSSSSAY